MGYDLLDNKGRRVSGGSNYTFVATLKSVLEKETGKKYQLQLAVNTEPVKKYKIAVLVEKPETVTAVSSELATVKDGDLRTKMRQKYPAGNKWRIDWKATKALNTPLSETDKAFFDEIDV